MNYAAIVNMHVWSVGAPSRFKPHCRCGCLKIGSFMDNSHVKLQNTTVPCSQRCLCMLTRREDSAWPRKGLPHTGETRRVMEEVCVNGWQTPIQHTFRNAPTGTQGQSMSQQAMNIGLLVPLLLLGFEHQLDADLPKRPIQWGGVNHSTD